MKYLINLFPKPQKSASDKVIYFAFHYLRYILVITQFVAICVFFYRFKVDQDIVDYREKADQKESIIDATSGLLTRVKEVDAKMKLVDSLLTKQDVVRSEFNYVYNRLPADMKIIAFQMKSDGVDLQGMSPSIDPVKTMYDSLQDEKRFKKINLSTIEKSEEGYVFTMTMSEYTP